MLQWGLEVIRSVQGYANPPLTVVMRIITASGGAAMYSLLFSVVYWCIDEKKGMHLGVIFLISAWINISFKFLLDQPRPFFAGYDPSVGMIGEHMGGLPSGHAQNSLVCLIIIASWIKRKQAYLYAALICLLIGFSRIYLGVHFPTDVLGGWILGGVILCGYFLLRAKIETLFVKGGFRAGIIACAAVSFIMILDYPAEEMLVLGGALFGLGAGYCLNNKYINFRNSALTEKTGAAKYLILLVRFLLGITGLVLILTAAGKIIPQNSANKNLYEFLRFALGGLWLCAGAPWVFIRLHLAESGQKE